MSIAAKGQTAKTVSAADLMDQLNNETADFITNVWVDYSLFAQAIAKNQVLTDSATIAQAMWPQITELKATLWHDSLMAKRINVTPDAVSQAYNGSDVRIFQHILVRSEIGRASCRERV